VVRFVGKSYLWVALTSRSLRDAMLRNGQDRTTLTSLLMPRRELGEVQLKARVHLAKWAGYQFWAPSDALEDAVGAAGSFTLLKALCDMTRFKASQWVACAAARHGHLDFLRALAAQGWLRADVNLCIDAAFGGNLEVLQYLRSSAVSCPWNATTFRAC
jgi:hypothetical protein